MTNKQFAEELNKSLMEINSLIENGVIRTVRKTRVRYMDLNSRLIESRLDAEIDNEEFKYFRDYWCKLTKDQQNQIMKEVSEVAAIA
jgi:hypothetical protein